MVTLITWGVILFEFFLFAGLVMDRRRRPVLLCLGILFHTGIAMLQDLLPFRVVMFGALILYLRSFDAPFHLYQLGDYKRKATILLSRAQRALR